ncbi:MAG: glyoxalase [Sphingobacteriales bacterium SCN 48-20]|jgi:catechol 2,3-dioxygenase-like lactoylglutathione lyase family enzyme|uniref:VOC family protein n=1 Tax=Terrimonas ferruginea TaxID=249 RepID=UPI00086D9A97|nr:VOC family protein [Terrimonas ferruginea]MBN8783263.1 VOC family protein [Terrimonas ferruginea]ODT93301.1 MAG: glyoxalase [Sphingobacteriales bacterium SCN 48-20]OJW39878.1 MAG: glyoxalase [Sphingobacteriales bacterium 48-107]
MITKMTITNIHVIDQDSAFDFYVNKLGFRVVDDIPMGPDTRWLTVSPPEQPDLQIVLFPVKVSKMFPQETAETLIALIRKGVFGCGVLTCRDVFATYEELKLKGVEFIKAPTKEFYGTEALFKDDSGNYFSLQPISNFDENDI